MSSEEKANLDFAFSLFEKFGREPYIGEAVSQLQHAQQAAALAEGEGFGDHVVVGPLLAFGVLRDKMNCTVCSVRCFLQVPLDCLGSMAEGSRTGTPVEL